MTHSSSKRGACLHCGEIRDLCYSHAIPHSFFRDIHRKNSGQAIVLARGTDGRKQTNDSGADYLLCKKCEAYLNKFDGYAYNWMTKTIRKIQEDPASRRFEVDPIRFSKFISSVVWRGTISRNPFFSKLDEALPFANKLKESFQDQALPFRSITCGVSALYDSAGIFPRAALTEVIFPPTLWRTPEYRTPHLATFFIVKGFVVFLAIPRLPFSLRQKTQFLRRNQPYVYVRDADIRTFPPYLWIEEGILSQLKDSST